MMLLPAITLARRELLRFVRERSRMVGVIASPILFWLVIGSGLNRSFHQEGSAGDVNYLEYFFPGSVVLIVLFAAIFSSISVIEDRREGFMQSVLVAPISRVSIAMGKVAGMTILASIQGTVLVLASPLVIPETTVGSLILTIGTLIVIALGLSSLGFALAWSMTSTQGFHAVMNLILIPMWMLSGALFPSSGASAWVATIMQWNPLTYGVSAIRESLYGLRPEHVQGLESFGASLIILLAFAASTSVAAVWQVSRRERGTMVAEEEGK